MLKEYVKNSSTMVITFIKRGNQNSKDLLKVGGNRPNPSLSWAPCGNEYVKGLPGRVAAINLDSLSNYISDLPELVITNRSSCAMEGCVVIEVAPVLEGRIPSICEAYACRFNCLTMWLEFIVLIS